MGKWIRGHGVKEALLQLQMNPLRPGDVISSLALKLPVDACSVYSDLWASVQMKSLVCLLWCFRGIVAVMLFKALLYTDTQGAVNCKEVETAK